MRLKSRISSVYFYYLSVYYLDTVIYYAVKNLGLIEYFDAITIIVISSKILNLYSFN